MVLKTVFLLFNSEAQAWAQPNPDPALACTQGQAYNF